MMIWLSRFLRSLDPNLELDFDFDLVLIFTHRLSRVEDQLIMEKFQVQLETDLGNGRVVTRIALFIF